MIVPFFPNPLKAGDTLAVIAPTGGAEYVTPESQEIANKVFDKLDYKLQFMPHSQNPHQFSHQNIVDRVEDIHSAFQDKNISGILSLIGGLNTIQTLSLIDYNIIKNNPKFFCGFSDMTGLQNSILAKTGLITFSGPHYSTFGIRHGNEFTIDQFHKVSRGKFNDVFSVSPKWSDDRCWIDQEDRHFIDNPGPRIINAGHAEGRLIGGNLSTIQLLLGSDLFPQFEDVILFVEDDEDVGFEMFDRLLESVLLTQKKYVRGLMIGRFQKNSNVTPQELETVLETRPYFKNVPIIAGVDFGHTSPMLTIPVGSHVKMQAGETLNIQVVTA